MIFAWTSTIFAGLTFLYAYKTYARDNYKLKFSISRMMSVQDRKEILKLDVTNIGRHKVSIARIIFKWAEKNKFYYIQEWYSIPRFKSGEYPYLINFGESFTITFDLDWLIQKFWKGREDKIIWFMVDDSLFKKYEIKIDFSIFPELKKDQT